MQKHLSIGEEVLAYCSTNRIDYYATNKRLLLFRSKSDYSTIEYEKISLTFNKYRGGWHILRAIIIFVVAYAMIADIALFSEIPFVVSVIIWLVSLFGLFLAISVMYAYYQIESPEIREGNLKRWRIPVYRWINSKTKQFADIVNDRITESKHSGRNGTKDK